VRPLGKVAHEVFVELVVGLAGFLLIDGRSFVFFDGHGNIVAHCPRSDHQDWPPLWMAPAKVLKVRLNGWAEVGEGTRQRSSPGRAETRDLGAGLGGAAPAGAIERDPACGRRPPGSVPKK
jgi:hypothetical protein